MTSHTLLERRDREKRMARFYSLSVQPNLFGGHSLICEWGRIGQRGGRIHLQLYDSDAEARAAWDAKLRDKQRRGYG